RLPAAPPPSAERRSVDAAPCSGGCQVGSGSLAGTVADQGVWMFRTRRMVSRMPVVVAATCAGLILGALVARAAGAASLDGVPAFGHTFLIVGENTSASEVTRRH